MNKEERYFECIFTDGTREDFDKLCTKVDEFGRNKDMIIFMANNNVINKFVVLQIIPKNQIRQIINRYAESDIKELI